MDVDVDVDINVDVAIAATGDTSRLPIRKILILDDDSFFRELVKRLLTSRGYETLEARSPAEADALLSCKPDLAIIDYRLPGADGTVYIESLRQRGCNFPIVFCSGSTYSQQTLATVRNLLGVDLILRKPINSNEFLEHIQTLLPVPEILCISKIDITEEQPVDSTEDATRATESAANFEVPESIEYVNENYSETPPVQDDEAATTLAMLAALSIEYIAELPSMIAIIHADFSQGMRDQQQEHFQSASDMAHRIRGTAGSFGLEDVSRIAGLLEDTIDREVLDSSTGSEKKNSDDSYTQNAILELIESLENAVAAVAARTAPSSNFTPDEASESSDIESYEDFTAPTDAHKILIVTSSDQLLQEISGSLSETSNLDVQFAQSAVDVFPMLNTFNPDVILIDAELPNINGNDLSRMIRCNSLWARLKIVVILPDAAFVSRDQAYRAGADDYIVKPIIEKELMVRIQNH